MRQLLYSVLVLLVMIMAGCATLPVGPSVRVMPASGKPYDLFQSEDSYCRRVAEREIGMSPGQIANDHTATGAVVGTALGTGLGAAIGAASGNVGAGAAIGAVSGLLVGTAAGSDSGRLEGREAQHRYDTVYLQCMYSYGNQVNSSGRVYYQRRTVVAPPPAGYDQYTPPDYAPGYPPPDTPPPYGR
jgi:outer membrane lipoprotein SlyB